MSELRPCMVMVKDKQKVKGENVYQDITVEKPALFHRFGEGIGWADDARIAITVAIIEMKETGQVQSVAPESVRFTDV